MKRGYLISCFLLMLAVLMTDGFQVSAQVVNTESFDGTAFPPAGWSATGGAQSLWVRRTQGINPTCATHSGAGMARFTSDMQVQPGDQEVLTSPVVNYIGASGSIPKVTFWVYRDNSSTAGDSVTFYVNTANSVTGAVRIGAVARSRFFLLPINETANGWYQYTFNVPVSFNTDTNYILLRGTAHNGGNVFIDDIEWDEYPTVCSSPLASGVTASTSLICNGSGSTQLTLAGTGLTGGGLSFQWQSSNDTLGPWTDFGASASSVSSGTISASTWYRCFVTCTNGSVTDTSAATLVQVSGSPAPVVGVSSNTVTACSGAVPVTLVANGALTYTWQPSLSTNAAGDSAYAAPTGNTTYIVTGTDSAGCSDSASVVFNVLPSPVVNASGSQDTVCLGQSLNLNALVPPPNFGIQYVWQPGNLQGGSQFITPSANTQYVVTATSNQNGCSGNDTVLVVVNPVPVPNFSFTSSNLTYTFTDNSTGAISWLWNFGDGNTDTLQNPLHTYSGNGNYAVTLTVSNGLCSNTFSVNITVVSVKDLAGSVFEMMSVYPNPVSGLTALNFNSMAGNVQMTVLDHMGQLILAKELTPVSQNYYHAEVNMSPFAKGVYMVRLIAGGQSREVLVVKD